MTKAEYIQYQKDERAKILDSILHSKSKKRLIVAGAGTGKTFTFGEILKLNPDGANIAMTFIRLLRNDMAGALGEFAEVRTFHEFCKKILHENRGGFLLYPKLTQIISEDATHLNKNFGNFDDKFQMLDESGNDLKFYLKRGDYYNSVSFNDSVYRMWKELIDSPDIISNFDQILIDEFQDFNPLEVAFINELEKKGKILIVGDDDQAVYDSRFSTPKFLREKYQSGSYETFELPFCSRCTDVIVNATNKLIKVVQKKGNLEDRIPKHYECFFETKDADNKKYPYITTAKLTNIPTVIKFIQTKIAQISSEEIAESWEEGKEYPTVLVVGARQYLNPIYKALQTDFENITFKQSPKNEVSICDGYDFLIQSKESNLGWRILIDFLMPDSDIKTIIEKAKKDVGMTDLLPGKLIKKQKEIVSIIKKLRKKEADIDNLLLELEKLVNPDLLSEIKERFLPKVESEIEIDKSEPSILLTSYQGCKGMSAGFVFIVGANNGVMPKDTSNITDVEISQFIVALTRTRKKCFILSEDWMYSPRSKNGNWIPRNDRSIFIDMISGDRLEDLGSLKSSQIK
jgi:superfamily I DNA/RNA helicase